MEIKLKILFKWLINRIEYVDSALDSYKLDKQEFILEKMGYEFNDILNVLKSLNKFLDFEYSKEKGVEYGKYR